MTVPQIKIGDRYSRLVVLELIPDSKNPKARCRCDCGKECAPQRGALRNGRAKTCGCGRRYHGVTHGRSKSKEYLAWRNIKARCNNPNNKHYKNYGARGIRCDYGSFAEFYLDVGPPPAGAWIDRINNELSYSAGNVRWVTPKENQENKRVSKIWVIDGVSYASSTDAATALDLNPSTINRRCNGDKRNGKRGAPRPGWSCQLKYPQEAR